MEDFPSVFTIQGSNRHEVILVPTDATYHDVKAIMEAQMTSSPNCMELLAKYRNKTTRDAIKEIRVRWSGRDKQILPRDTILTEANTGAVLRLMVLSRGQDVFDVKVESVPVTAAQEVVVLGREKGGYRDEV